MNAVARDFRVAPQNAQRCLRATGVVGRAICKDWIGAGVFQKRVDEACAAPPGARVAGEPALEIPPACQTVFQRERMLNMTQADFSRSVWMDSLETSARLYVVCAQGFEPTLCFFLQIVEIGIWRELSAHGNLPPRYGPEVR